MEKKKQMTSDMKASKQVVELKKEKKSILKWLEYPSTKSKTTLKDRLKHKSIMKLQIEQWKQSKDKSKDWTFKLENRSQKLEDKTKWQFQWQV